MLSFLLLQGKGCQGSTTFDSDCLLLLENVNTQMRSGPSVHSTQDGIIAAKRVAVRQIRKIVLHYWSSVVKKGSYTHVYDKKNNNLG